MVKRAGIASADTVLEIGPGGGFLTKALLAADCAHLDAVEIDTRLRPDLEAIAATDSRLALHWADAVQFDYGTLASPPDKVVANLPYHITTPILWRLLESFSGRGTDYYLLMVQKEAADRIVSGAGVRESNPLGITLAAMGSATVGRKVPRGAFTPMPRVDSAIVEIRLSGDNVHLPRDRAWRRLLQGSFAQRRKTLINNWSAAFGVSKAATTETLAAHALPPLSRPEELRLESWLALAMDHEVARWTGAPDCHARHP